MQAVLFDLDGTLLDTTEGVLESAIYAAKEMGYHVLSRETMLKFVGPPIQKSFMDYYGSSKEDAQKAANIFRDYYKNKALLKAEPYGGIYELMQYLRDRDIKMAVATYKREDYALTLLRHYGFDKYCISMHGADNNNKLTKADIIELCISEMDVPKEEVVLIGDTEHDALGAKKAGISFIGVTYGFGFKSKEDLDKYCNIGCCDNPMMCCDYI